jgi:serine protease SohB
MEMLSEYALFLAKAITIVASILGVVAGITGIIQRGRGETSEGIEVKHLNQRYAEMANALRTAMLPRKEWKQALRVQKKQHKALQHKGDHRKRIFVLDFNGDLRASAVSSLREEITAVLAVARPEDEVFVRLESPGGMVTAYGLAASQLLRIKDKKILLVVAADKVAASGGYMMACVADRIMAAPFALVGSIGVVGQLPNFHRWLKNNSVDFEQFTAGEYKRTLTIFGQNTDKGRQKFQEEIEETHQLFKNFIKEHRIHVDLAQVATGEHWYGAQALELNLIDEVRTSDDYLMQASQNADIYEVTYKGKKPLLARLLSHIRLLRHFAGAPLQDTPSEYA